MATIKKYHGNKIDALSVGQVYTIYITWRRATTTLPKLYQLGKGKIGFKIVLKKARVRYKTALQIYRSR
jgi:hypothetical protein